jgi:hypothetical protein
MDISTRTSLSLDLCFLVLFAVSLIIIFFCVKRQQDEGLTDLQGILGEDTSMWCTRSFVCGIIWRLQQPHRVGWWKQQDHVDVTDLFRRTMLMSLTWCFWSTSHTLFQVIWGINICDLKIVVFHLYQLGTFIVCAACFVPRYTSPPRPTRTCGSPHWEGENLICWRWWSEGKELFIY